MSGQLDQTPPSHCFQTIILFVSVILVNLLIMYVSIHIRQFFSSHFNLRDGKSNYMEGVM